MKRILVVEDEQNIREFVVINLKRAGYEVTEADSGESALTLYEQQGGQFEIVLLDIMLPGVDGITVCQRIREKNSRVGIIMLTAKSQELDKISALTTGADDYVTKPFSPSELVARIDALFRRVSAVRDEHGSAEEIISGDFTLNVRSHVLSRGDSVIELTQVEFQIMEYFFQNAGEVLSRVSILHHVWGEGYYGEEKVVDVNIRRLRMKVEEDPSNPKHILTVWGLGYKWDM